MEGDYCVGILLQYDDFHRTVGQFRHDNDKVMFEYLFTPAYIALNQRKHDGRNLIRIEFYEHAMGPNGIALEQLHEMAGSIIWWYGTGGASAVSFLP
jgi:hypothetical protein